MLFFTPWRAFSSKKPLNWSKTGTVGKDGYLVDGTRAYGKITMHINEVCVKLSGGTCDGHNN